MKRIIQTLPKENLVLHTMVQESIEIKNLPIRLGQFLKLANLVQDGFEAKLLIQNGLVNVNGQTENRRGRKLVEMDRVQVDEGITYVLLEKESN